MPNSPSQSSLMYHFERFNDAYGNKLIVLRRNGIIELQGVTYPDGTVQTTASAGISGNFSTGETPSGSVDSSNVTFTLAHTPIAGSVALYQNGMRLSVTTDYTISSATITFNSAPITGDIVRTDYRY